MFLRLKTCYISIRLHALRKYEDFEAIFTARCYAERVVDMACRLSVRPSVRLSVCLSVILMDCDHIH